MNLHEYQGKELLKKFGVAIPEGMVAESIEKAVEVAGIIQDKTGSDKLAVKAQVHAGGRGKAGGVKVAKNLEELKLYAGKIIGMKLVTPQTGAKGKIVKKVMIQEDAYKAGKDNTAEFYISILLNRQLSKNMIVYSTEGGSDIEEVAERTPHLIFSETIDPEIGLLPFQCRKIAFNLGLKGQAFKEMTKFVDALYKAYKGIDASLIEINPVSKTSDNHITAIDSKITIDNNALFRHPDIAKMRDYDEEDPTEVEADKYDLNYVKLEGNVGCMVNGAGLAMATMDIIKLSGGDPANFLDVGGSADAKRVEEGFRIILKDQNVKAILVNIFGGIVRCDRVANGIVDAYKNIGDIDIPIIVRLQGTNADEAKEIIDKSGLKVYSAVKLQEAADLVNQLV